MSDLAGNPEDRFSQNEAHISDILTRPGLPPPLRKHNYGELILFNFSLIATTVCCFISVFSRKRGILLKSKFQILPLISDINFIHGQRNVSIVPIICIHAIGKSNSVDLSTSK